MKDDLFCSLILWSNLYLDPAHNFGMNILHILHAQARHLCFSKLSCYNVMCTCGSNNKPTCGDGLTNLWWWTNQDLESIMSIGETPDRIRSYLYAHHFLFCQMEYLSCLLSPAWILGYVTLVQWKSQTYLEFVLNFLQSACVKAS